MMKLLRISILLFLMLMIFRFSSLAAMPDLPERDSAWVDSVINSLSLEQKIAQLMIIRVSSMRDSVYDDSIVKTIREYNPGGVCFFRGTPFTQGRLTNRLQQNAQTPLIISTDAEWGLGMRLDSVMTFPRQMTLGAIADNTLIYNMASAIADQCKRIGVNVDFAPVVDINNNPANPVIGSRSFGESVFNVTAKSMAYVYGLQDHGVFATAKHFPGHGDTDVDSHLGLPVLPFDSARLDSVELFPFRELIRRGLDGVMNGHLYLPKYNIDQVPSTLSKNIVTGLLRNKLDFTGIAVTDALDMKGVTKIFPPGKIEFEALVAGNDILLLPQSLPIAVKYICDAVDSGFITVNEIEAKCRKILMMKTRIGLTKVTPVKLESITADLSPVSSEVLKRQLYKASVTIVKNDNDLIPLNFLEYKRIAVLSIGDTQFTPFQLRSSSYTRMLKLNMPLNFDTNWMNSILQAVSEANIVIISVHTVTNLAGKRFGIPENVQRLIDSLSVSKRIILDIFGTPYTLSLFRNTSKIETILISYQDDPVCEDISAEAIFGGIAVSGKLPVTGSTAFPLNTGIATEKGRLEFTLPEELGIPSKSLATVDSIALDGIRKGAYPGCQVIFAKDGKIFYRKAFGYTDNMKTDTVDNEQIYDLASLTKVLATTLAVMKLHDEGKIDPDKTLGTYLPMVRGSNKENLIIREIMAHQAGLQPWIPFFEKTIRDRKLIPGVYDSVPSVGFPIKVAEKMFMRKDYADSVYHWILESPLRDTRDYKYSDLGFYLLALTVEQVTGQDFARFLDSTFYAPLGLKTTGFLPVENFPLNRIIPTENDQLFRKQLVHGYVHDPGAAMLGGVAGHAGLFSDATDVAVILQMLMNGGHYGGRQYLLPSTIKEFTRVQFPVNGNRRAMGFDKQLPVPSHDGPVCVDASPSSWGHSGFTGTYFWADPENGLTYVFLSNRVNPDASNQKLSEMNIRTKIHQTMYDILKSVKTD